MQQKQQIQPLMRRIEWPALAAWLAGWLRPAALALAGVNLAGLLLLMLLRARFPFELEWIESATADSARWILAGRPLFGPPSLEFIPLLYTPLYFYLSAAVMALTGPGFLGPRLVSIAAVAAGCLLIRALVRHETGQGWAGWVGAGFYAATFQVTGAWMDVARSDSLLIGLLLLAAYAARRVPGRWGPLACAGVLGLAYLAKQSALPFFVAFGAYYLLGSRREWLVFWPAAALFVLGPIWLFDQLTDGWYTFYTWYIVQQIILDAERIRAFWMVDLLGRVPLALLGSAVALAGLGNPLRRSPEGERSRFYWLLGVGALTASWWNRAAAGAHTNTLMPALAMFGVLLGLLLAQVQAPSARPLLRLGALLGVVVQFVWLVYDPRAVLPTARDEQAGYALLARLRAYPGEVFVPAHSYYAVMAGKPGHVHWASYTDASGIWDTNLDVQRGGTHDPRRQGILDEVAQAVAAQRYSAIVLDDNDKEYNAYWRDLLAPYYRPAEDLFADSSVFWTVSGVPSRPQLVFVPR